MLKNQKTRDKIEQLIFAAMIAALYIALTLSFAAISYGSFQCRISEALTILPVFTPFAIPGLAVGCMISNIFGMTIIGPWDILIGSAATLAAAICTYFLRNIKIKDIPILAPLPPVIINAVVIGLELSIVQNTPFIIDAFFVFLGQTAACYVLGIPLYIALKKVDIKF